MSIKKFLNNPFLFDTTITLIVILGVFIAFLYGVIELPVSSFSYDNIIPKLVLVLALTLFLTSFLFHKNITDSSKEESNNLNLEEARQIKGTINLLFFVSLLGFLLLWILPNDLIRYRFFYDIGVAITCLLSFGRVYFFYKKQKSKKK